jgi:HEAT repeat protein
VGQISGGYDVTNGLQTTWNVLSQTRNRAAQPVLALAMHSELVEIQSGAVRAIVRRKDSAAHEQLIRCFDALGDSGQHTLCDAHRETPHQMSAALAAAVQSGDPQGCKNACCILLLCHDFDQFPALIRAAENRHHRQAPIVSATMKQLAYLLLEDLSDPTSNLRQGGTDTYFFRRQIVRALERSVSDFARHYRQEILEAFLVLSPAGNDVLERILQDTHHPCHEPALAVLASSDSPAIIGQLVTLLHDATVPIGVLRIIAQRVDHGFLETLLRGLKKPVPLRVLNNMSRLHRVSWLEEKREQLLALDGQFQATAFELAVATSINHHALFELLAMILRRGSAEGRRAACRALAEFRGPEADELVVAALADPDGGVQAAAVRQLRDRQLPDALPMLVRMLDSPAPEVREAARSSLSEFNFVRYRTMFDLLDEKTLRTTGALVNRVDPSSYFRLAEELSSPSASHRRRGIAMAVAMDAASDVRDKLIALSEDEEVSVRVEAVAALRHCRGLEVMSALQLALHDPHRAVREAATASLAAIRAPSQRAEHQGPLQEATSP